jgi:hypothetical protein
VLVMIGHVFAELMLEARRIRSPSDATLFAGALE